MSVSFFESRRRGIPEGYHLRSVFCLPLIHIVHLFVTWVFKLTVVIFNSFFALPLLVLPLAIADVCQRTQCCEKWSKVSNGTYVSYRIPTETSFGSDPLFRSSFIWIPRYSPCTVPFPPQWEGGNSQKSVFVRHKSYTILPLWRLILFSHISCSLQILHKVTLSYVPENPELSCFICICGLQKFLLYWYLSVDTGTVTLKSVLSLWSLVVITPTNDLAFFPTGFIYWFRMILVIKSDEAYFF